MAIFFSLFVLLTLVCAMLFYVGFVLSGEKKMLRRMKARDEERFVMKE